MNFSYDDNELEKALTDALGPPPNVDFDAWRRQHSEAIACLNPQRMNALAKRRRLTSRVLIFATAATVLFGVWLGTTQIATNGPGNAAFAQVLSQIEKAKTVTWTQILYLHTTFKDDKRTWLTSEVWQCAYKSPGLYREVILDENMHVKSVTITDAVHLKELKLNPATKEAVVSEVAATPKYPGGPFVWVQSRLKGGSLTWVGKQKYASGVANVFRNAFISPRDGKEVSQDFWIDEKTKRLVEMHDPGSDLFDPEIDPARPKRPEEVLFRSLAGYADREIIFDAEIDDSLFRLDPPEGYALQTKPRLYVTEKDMVDYLGIQADYNDKIFLDDPQFLSSLSTIKLNKTYEKPEKERTPAEQKLIDTLDYYRLNNLVMYPLRHFLQDNTVENSFRYLGKGVKLGDKDRIVCWYKLKGAKTYRVVYGDLSIQDAAPEDLPLSAEP